MFLMAMKATPPTYFGRLLNRSTKSKRSTCFKPSVAINGFGRIGKCLLRKAFNENLNVVAVNQPFVDVQAVANALKYDSVYGIFDGYVEAYDDVLCINGKRVKVFHEQNPDNLKWDNVPVDYVIDASGKFTDKAKAAKHIKAGAKRVIVTGPCKDAPTFVRGVNFDSYRKAADMSVVSNSSSLVNCVAPLLNALRVTFGVHNCMLTTVQTMSASQHAHDGCSDRSALNNIVIGPTDAPGGLGTVVPELLKRIDGDAVLVPVPNVSLLKLYINVCKENVTANVVKQEIAKRSECELQNVLHYVTDKCVSSDFIGCTNSAVVDFNQIHVIDKLITIGMWYDNEMAYSCRVLDLLKHMIQVDSE